MPFNHFIYAQLHLLWIDQNKLDLGRMFFVKQREEPFQLVGLSIREKIQKAVDKVNGDVEAMVNGKLTELGE
jgi:hypothetical protein